LKISENWLRTFVNPPLSTRELAHAVTMSGLEVEAIEPAAPPFDGVVVGQVLRVERHPDADRLVVCHVNVGGEPLTIVCGAPNARAGLKVPAALPGAKLLGKTVGVARVRGVESHGMLCSDRDLGLPGEGEGLLALPEDAAPGRSVREVLDLDDQLLTLKPTPNRGDCLSVLGVGREVAAVTGTALRMVEIKPVRTAIVERCPVLLDAPQACPRYCGRIVRNVNARAATPEWMVRRLTRSGLRPISALVDITNYVMLELGQPLHAFDYAKLEGGIRVRFARAGDKLTLLNGDAPELGPGHLLIADERKPIALAGVMGGLDTAVGDATKDLFLESAFFAPDAVAGKSRALQLTSEAAYRFERGVDFGATANALERATQLVLEICGGAAGPVSEGRAQLPGRDPVRLRLKRVERLLGIRFEKGQVSDILRRLRFESSAADEEFRVTPPTYRFDIAIEEDLVEELARIYGYDRIPPARPAAPAAILPQAETQRVTPDLRGILVRRDYQEVVTYSFVDADSERDLAGNPAPVALANPIASHLSVMRSSLAGSLLGCVAHNVSRRQPRVRLFEVGRCFERADAGGYRQPVRLGGVAYGDALPEQWGSRPARPVDFYDVKGDVEAVLAPRVAVFRPQAHPALHPGKSAVIELDGAYAGWIGELHPRWQRKYDLPAAPVLFELEYEALKNRGLPAYTEISKFPLVRRDIAVEVDEGVAYGAILEELNRARPPIVTEIGLFDIYRGTGVEKGKKSLAFSVLLQDTRKTLTDAEVESAVVQLRAVLTQRFNAKLR
jgi:phenylalanyl-tRNA synthetase beta chain